MYKNSLMAMVELCLKQRNRENTLCIKITNRGPRIVKWKGQQYALKSKPEETTW